jgi:AI-2 transport protein TqsA
MLIFVMYLLMERQTDPRKGGDIADLNLKALGMKKEINVQIRKYITVKSFVSLLKGVIIGVVLSAASVPLAPVFGLLTFVLNFIPNVRNLSTCTELN